MTRYVDIGIVRIQQYLSRTPTLRGRRGASSELVAAMQVDQALLGERAKPNVEAGQVDGVLSLVVTKPGTEDSLVRDLLAHLRQRLPGAQFQVSSGDGPDYLNAYTTHIKPQIERGEALVDLPASAEFPLVALCGICGTDPATESYDLGEDDGIRAICADCVMRHSTTVRRQGRTSENRLAEQIGAAASPAGFNELASLAAGDAKEHLATVHADGNRVGAFFDALAAAGDIDRAAVVRQLADCTFEALAAATCAVRRRTDTMLCVVPHLVGGDDVLVTLPADRAWRFTTEFLHDFGVRAQRLVRNLRLPELLEPPQLRVPTMSAGLVFGRRNHPFALTVEEAQRGLYEAKSAGGGLRPWLQFVDLVADGTVGFDRPVSLAALRAHRASLNTLVSLPTSSRTRLSEALNKGGEQAARVLAARLGNSAVIAPFMPEHGTELTPEEDDLVIDLAQALRIARWWR